MSDMTSHFSYYLQITWKALNMRIIKTNNYQIKYMFLVNFSNLNFIYFPGKNNFQTLQN